MKVKGEEFKKLDEFITRQVRLGPPLSHIYTQHCDELPVGLRGLYNDIDSNQMTIRNIDLRRKVGYPEGKGNPNYLMDWWILQMHTCSFLCRN